MARAAAIAALRPDQVGGTSAGAECGTGGEPAVGKAGVELEAGVGEADGAGEAAAGGEPAGAGGTDAAEPTAYGLSRVVAHETTAGSSGAGVGRVIETLLGARREGGRHESRQPPCAAAVPAMSGG